MSIDGCHSCFHSRACAIKKATHGLRRDAEEVGPVAPMYVPLIDELEVGLVDQGGRCQRLICVFAAEVGLGEPLQLDIQDLDEFAFRRPVPLAPGHEEPSDIVG